MTLIDLHPFLKSDPNDTHRIKVHKAEILRRFAQIVPEVESGDWADISVRKNAVWLQFNQNDFETVELTIRIDFRTLDINFSWRYLNFMPANSLPSEKEISFDDALACDLPFAFRNMLIYNLPFFMKEKYSFNEFFQILGNAACLEKSSTKT